MELIIFILVAYGLTQILVYGSVLNSIRPKEGSLGELFQCPMCMGWWVGFILCVISPFTPLFTFEPNFITPILLGCLSSGTSYILCQTFDDEGIKIKGSK